MNYDKISGITLWAICGLAAARGVLLWIGFIRLREDESIRWPFKGPPRWVFRSWREFSGYCKFVGPLYRFRNLPGVIKWEKGRLLPSRWGFGVYGFEFGDRGG